MARASGWTGIGQICPERGQPSNLAGIKVVECVVESEGQLDILRGEREAVLKCSCLYMGNI